MLINETVKQNKMNKLCVTLYTDTNVYQI